MSFSRFAASEKPTEIAKPKGRGGSRKGAIKTKKDDDEEMLSLQERLAAYNLGPSGDKSAGKIFIPKGFCIRKSIKWSS